MVMMMLAMTEIELFVRMMMVQLARMILLLMSV
jgi:hypothetical protein